MPHPETPQVLPAPDLVFCPVARPWPETQLYQCSGPWELFWRPGCPCALQEQIRYESCWVPVSPELGGEDCGVWASNFKGAVKNHWGTACVPL